MQGYRLSIEMMTEVMLKGCNWAWQGWLKKERVEQQ